MPDKKLTDNLSNNSPILSNSLSDNEIKKALECCIKSNHFGECFDNKCPCVSENGCKMFTETLYPYALDLINRLQAEKEALINGQQTLQKYIAEQKAENERLKPFEDKFAEFSSHIRVEDMLVCASSLGEWLEFCDNLKAEAYKEFAEELKIRLGYRGIIRNPEFVDLIDNLLKEMVGDNQ